MGSWRRMGAFLGLVPDDGAPADEFDYDSDYGGDYDSGRYAGSGYEPDREPEYTDRRPPRHDSRTVRGRGEADDFTGPVTHGALAMQVEPETRRSADSAAAVRPLTVKLTGFGEARIVGERYRDGTSVILDMTELSDADARRVVDFAAGLAFALHGSIDKVTARVFMLLPPHADLSAEDRRAFAGSYADRYAYSAR